MEGTPATVSGPGAIPSRDYATADWSVLMARSQNGDQAAYRALLTAIIPYVRGLARRGGVDGADAEDIVQNVLLTIHAVRQTYDPSRPFGPWLAAVARHRIVDGQRRLGRFAARETVLDERHETFPADDAKYHDEADDARQLHVAIAALPAGQRQAIEMLRLKEMSLKEASAQSGQSETALKVALHRAIKRLRTLLHVD